MSDTDRFSRPETVAASAVLATPARGKSPSGTKSPATVTIRTTIEISDLNLGVLREAVRELLEAIEVSNAAEAEMNRMKEELRDWKCRKSALRRYDRDVYGPAFDRREEADHTFNAVTGYLGVSAVFFRGHMLANSDGCIAEGDRLHHCDVFDLSRVVVLD